MRSELHVGIVGAGIGGVLASIAMARAGCKVTILEAAEQLGEIGAGIQMVSPRIMRRGAQADSARLLTQRDSSSDMAWTRSLATIWFESVTSISETRMEGRLDTLWSSESKMLLDTHGGSYIDTIFTMAW